MAPFNPLKPIPELQTINSPLEIEVWTEALSNHPDHAWLCQLHF